VFSASPPQDGFAVVNLGQCPRTQSNRKAPALKARFTSRDSLIRPLT